MYNSLFVKNFCAYFYAVCEGLVTVDIVKSNTYSIPVTFKCQDTTVPQWIQKSHTLE